MQLKDIIKVLKDKREELGLTIEEVSRQTKINSMVLSNIEQGEIKKISGVYLKGFLKIYIQFLGLERELFPAVDEALKKENAGGAVKRTVEAPKRERARHSRPQGPSGGKLLADLLRKHGRTVVVVVGVFFAAIVLMKGCSAVAKKLQVKKKPSVSGRAIFPVKLDKPSTSRSVSAPAAAVSEVKIESKQQKKSADLHMAIRAKRDCFVRLKKDGVIVFDGVIPRGTIESWVAQKEIEVSINDSTAVEVEVNGETVSLGSRKRSIKSLKITPGSIHIQ